MANKEEWNSRNSLVDDDVWLDVLGPALCKDPSTAALKLYQLSLSGHLTPQNDPLRVINEAIERARAKVERGNADEGKRERESKRKKRP